VRTIEADSGDCLPRPSLSPKHALELIDFEMEQVPKWLSPKEKHPLRSAACVAAMIRLRLLRTKNAPTAVN
jgi:hypothetical protein